jgi:hypothetical protein
VGVADVVVGVRFVVHMTSLPLWGRVNRPLLYMLVVGLATVRCPTDTWNVSIPTHERRYVSVTRLAPHLVDSDAFVSVGR